MLTWLDRVHARIVQYRLLHLLTMAVRVLLALAFVPSGLVKILGQPFTTLPVSNPVGFFFAGFFSAAGYYRFIGVAQWTAVILLMIPRTALLGAFLFLPIILNIAVITISMGRAFGVTRLITAAMLLANLWLLAWDWDRWRDVVWPRTTVPNRHGHLSTVIGLLAAAGLGLRGAVAVNMALVQDRPLAVPVVVVVIAATLGIAMATVAWRRTAHPVRECATASADS